MSNIQTVGVFDPKSHNGLLKPDAVNCAVKVDLAVISPSKLIPVKFNKAFRPTSPNGTDLWAGVHVPTVHCFPPAPPQWVAGSTGMIPQDLATALFNHTPSICTPSGWGSAQPASR